MMSVLPRSPFLGIHFFGIPVFGTQRALRDRLMSRGKNCLPTVSRQFLTRNYPRPNCLLKCLPNCLFPTREGFLSSFKINPAVRVIARQVRDKNCLAAIFAPRHQSVSSGPLGIHFVPESLSSESSFSESIFSESILLFAFETN